MTEKTASNPLGIFRFSRIIIPIILGLGVGFFMVGREYARNSAVFSDLASRFTSYSVVCLIFAVLFECMREFMYMYRIKLLSDGRLSWKQSFQIIMLWEFSSTVTPTSVGGSAVALFIVGLEGIGAGRSTAMVMIATLMDELFYIVMAPLTIMIVGGNIAFATDFRFSVLGLRFSELNVFLIGYSFMMILTLVILLAIFLFPKRFRNFLYSLGKKKLLSRWDRNFRKMGDDVVVSAEEFRHKNFLFWLKTYLATVLSWSSRFLVLNCVLLAFNPEISNHLLVYVRQLVMWIVLCISPTPGSSGVAEFAFPLFLKEFLPENLKGIMALLWRMFTYYPYIIIGLIVLPMWTSRIYKRQKNSKADKNQA